MTERERILEIINEASRPLLVSDLIVSGVSRMAVSRLVAEGVLQRPMRGVVRVPHEDEDTNFIWACVALACPRSIVCMLSAASYHGLTEAMAGVNSFAIPNETRAMDGYSIDGGARFMRLRNERDFSEGISKIKVEGVEVSITSPERTIIDLFRYSSYFKRSVKTDLAIDAEGFQDALARYLDSDFAQTGQRELRRLARLFGVWEPLKLVIETNQSVRAALNF